MTPFQLHVQKWKDCTRCPLHETRTSVVITRGKLPCDVLFVGEAPGASEDVLGKPFIGPAGKLLDEIIANAQLRSNATDLRLAFTNLIGCIPLQEDEEGGTSKASEPSKASIKACAPKLTELATIAKPKLVVLVGALSQKNALAAITRYDTICKIIHPAALLRMHIAQRPLAIQKTLIELTDAFEAIPPF